MRISTVIMAAAVSLCATTALAAESVGLVMAATDATSVSGQVDERPLTEKLELLVGDRVATGAIGEAQLLFGKRMYIALAPNTSLGIDDDAATKQISLFLHEGSMRVVLGGSRDEYTFQTDYATVIPLGTAFDLTALPNNGGTKLVLLEGQVKLCGEDDDCETVATPCALLQAGPGQDVEEIEAGKERVQEAGKHFPFLTDQSSLREELQFPRLGCLDGGVAPFPLGQPAIQVGAAVGVGAIILCIVLCPSTTSTVDTNNGTN